MRATGYTLALIFSVAMAACGSGEDKQEEEPPVGTDPDSVGRFGESFDWPVVSMHLALLPDGRVMSFGSTTDGRQGAMLHYNVWDPTQGTGPSSMLLLPNTTPTDISCAGQTLLPATGELLIVGGDRTVDGQRNHANGDVNLFDAGSNTLTRQVQPMAYQLWYATAVTTGSGDQVVLGGMVDRTFTAPVVVYPAFSPEIFRTGTGWRTLSGATSEEAFAAGNEGWYYPRAWLAPNGRIFMLAHNGKMFDVSVSGAGQTQVLRGDAGLSTNKLPSVMFEPGRILSVRTDRRAVVVDIRGEEPAVTPTDDPSWDRQYGSATLLADGKVWVNGGSNTGNDLAGVALHSELWDPATGRWTTAASAAKPRLYHSASLLLPDATVLTSGGGVPGPVTNLNAEIYYPPYLFRPGAAGELAPRPSIAAAPTVVQFGQEFQVEMADTQSVGRVTLVRAGSATHSFNGDQRLIEMKVVQDGKQLHLEAPAQPELAPPGFYLLFAFDAKGVPSIARMIRLVG
jgi:hypothetical protein